MNSNGNNPISWKTCARLGATAVLVYLLLRYWGVVEEFVSLLCGGLLAIVAGFIIAYIVNIPMRFFENKLPGPTGDGTRNRTISMVLAIVCIVAVLLFVLILVIPQLVIAIVTLATDAPDIIDKFTSNEFVRSVIPAGALLQLQSIEWEQVVNDVAAWLQSGIINSLPQITSALGQIGACFMGVVLACWFLTEKNKLGGQFHSLLKTYAGERFDARYSRAVKLFDGCFHGYIVGQSCEAVIFGSLVFVASTIAGIPDSLMLGALVGVMSLIPMVGALIGAILCALIIFVTSWQQAIIFFVLFFIVQQIEANFIYPKVVGRHVGLTGMWPLIGVTLGAALLGISGAFIGVPLIAAIFRIVENDMTRRAQLPKDTPAPLVKLQRDIIEE